MGFRNKLRTATAVDTTDQAGSAGVRIYNYETQVQRIGILEFSDGRPGDAPSQIRSTANLIPQGEGNYTGVGGTFTVAAGSWNGLDGPDLALGVRENPAGGYRRVASLIDTDLATVPVPWQIDGVHPTGWAGQVPDVFRNVPFAPLGPAWASEMYIDAAGIVHLEALLTYTGAAGTTFAPGGVIASLPAAYWPRKNQYPPAQSNNAPATLQILTNGQVIYAGGNPIPSGGNVTVAHSYLSQLLG